MYKMSHTELSREKLKNQNKKSGTGGKKERQMRYEFCVNMAQLSPRHKVKFKQENASNSLIHSITLKMHSALARNCSQHCVSRKHGNLTPVKIG